MLRSVQNLGTVIIETNYGASSSTTTKVTELISV